MTYPRRTPGRFLLDEESGRHAVGQTDGQPIPGEKSWPVDADRANSGYPRFPSPAHDAMPVIHPGTSEPLAPPYQSSASSPAWHEHLPGNAAAGTTAVFPAVTDPVRPRASRGDRVADDLFFVALDDRNGQMRVHGDVVGPALAGALLMELALGEWIEVTEESVEPSEDAWRRQSVPWDALAHKILDTVLGQHDLLSPREWIEFLSATAEQEVAERLARANQIVVEQRRRALSRGTAYKPADVNQAAWPRARLSDHCRARRELNGHDLALAGLCHASGLLRNVLVAAPAGTYEQTIHQVYTRLAAVPSLIALFGAVESTVTADASKLA